MRRSIVDIEFPAGVKHLYINGKRFTRENFIRAKELEMRRGKKGRFISVNK